MFVSPKKKWNLDTNNHTKTVKPLSGANLQKDLMIDMEFTTSQSDLIW